MRPVTAQVELASDLAAPAERVWSHATDFRGINHELWPVLRMTSPPGWTALEPGEIQPGQRLFRSWLLFLGFLPIDYDDLTIAEIGPGFRFRERSRMLSAAVWEHDRSVVPLSAEACRVIDQVRFTPRWRPMGVVLRWIVPRLFAHRHRRLRRAFGVTPAGPPGSPPAARPARR